jgi:hypothetical protein
VRPGAPSRRDALRTGAVAAGAIAAGGLIRPLSAMAQASSTETEALRDFLGEAVAREQIIALAYAEAGQASGLDAGVERSLERFRTQTQAHVNALTSALESIGYDASDAPSDPQDDGVFDGADGIEDESATELGEQLAMLADPKSTAQHLELLITLSNQLIDYYAGNVAALDSEDLRTTSAEIAANVAQHVVVLRVASGESLAKALDVRAATDPPPQTGE